MRNRTDRLGQAVHEALLRLVRERMARKPGGHLIEVQLDELELPLHLALKGSDATAGRFTDRLIRAIDGLLDDAVQQAAAFRPGHAYCHRCESVVCEHSRPSSSRHVFIGYTPTGMPRWEDFAQYCLEIKHARVDQLYEDPPALVTLVQDKQAVEGGMLKAFHNPSYEVLGQIVAGFFPVRARAEEGRGVLALTVQVAASHAASGHLRLGLNLLGRTPAGDDLERLWERHEELPWRKGVRWAQSTLQTLVAGNGGGRRRRKHGASRPELQRRVDGILRSLARRLERDHRGRARRTRHAEERHASGRRPTPKALDDARAADGEALFVDQRNGTIVVLGDRGRTHFFTPDGKLVSSVRYSRDAIERKVKAELWRPAAVEQRKAFRDKLP